MAKKGDMNDNLFCSFCGKNQKEVTKLIAGPAVYICDECIQLCSEIIDEESEKTTGQAHVVKVVSLVEMQHGYGNCREQKTRSDSCSSSNSDCR